MNKSKFLSKTALLTSLLKRMYNVMLYTYLKHASRAITDCNEYTPIQALSLKFRQVLEII